ncbi:MAG: metalloregulator ArsR/SmtB family transcription factor [Gemmatimonadaceae bacterium]
MHAFDILGEPVRRRILELLERGERPAGDIGAIIQREFGISQPAVSQHLRVLRESGFTTVRADGTRRFYAVRPALFREVTDWVERYRVHWEDQFDALDGHLSAVQGRPVRSSRTRRRTRRNGRS